MFANGSTAMLGLPRSRRRRLNAAWTPQPVAHSGKRFDREAWRRLIDQPPQLADAAVQSVFTDGQAAPAAVRELVAGDCLARRLRHGHKDLHHATLQPHGAIADHHFAKRRANSDRVE